MALNRKSDQSRIEDAPRRAVGGPRVRVPQDQIHRGENDQKWPGSPERCPGGPSGSTSGCPGQASRAGVVKERSRSAQTGPEERTLTRVVPRPTAPATRSPSCRPKVSRMNDPMTMAPPRSISPSFNAVPLMKERVLADAVDAIDGVDQRADAGGATPDGNPQRDKRREDGFALARLDDGALHQRFQQWLQLCRSLFRDEREQRLGHTRSGVLVDDGRERDEHDQRRRHRVEQRICRLLGKLGGMVTANPLGDLDKHGVADVIRQQRGMNAREGFLDPRQARLGTRPGLSRRAASCQIAEQTSYESAETPGDRRKLALTLRCASSRPVRTSRAVETTRRPIGEPSGSPGIRIVLTP